MTLQISPVLAGTYDAPDYVAPHNIASAQTDNADEIDSRRYTKFDRSATDAGTMTNFSFGDFLDMINPLQHIPIISSIYREITGDTINPVSRVVGDIAYGGAMGIASGVIGAIGGAGDSVIEQSTGRDAVGTVVAALFGPGDKTQPTTQLAQAETAPANSASSPASTLTPGQINARAKLMASAVAAAAASAAQASMPSTGISSPAAQMAGASSAAGGGLLNQLAGNPATSFPISGAKTFVLPPRNLPYGGVMAPPLQGDNMALALANAAPGVQMNHMVYTGRTFAGPRLQPAASAPVALPPVSGSAASTPTPPASSIPGAYVSTAAPNELPPSLMNDIAALRAINTYRSTASQSGSSGTNLNVVN